MNLLPVGTEDEIAAALPSILEQLDRDALVAYPTETVYGIGGALTERAVERLRALKRRETHKPFLVLVPDVERAPGVQWSAAARAIAARFWPGPLTLALPAVPNALPAGIIADDGRVAVRASPHRLVRAINGEWGAITSTSANAPGTAPARDAASAIAALEALGADDVLVLDGGELPQSDPSTIVAVDDHTARVLRAGAITADDLRNELSGIGIHVG